MHPDGTELTDLGASLLMGHSGLDPSSVDPSTIDVQPDVLFNQVVDSGAVFIASVMPVMSWEGLTKDNNTKGASFQKLWLCSATLTARLQLLKSLKA